MAPAGNFESLHAAIQGGADSVYFGVGNLNMRSHSANNFHPEDLAEVVRICREAGVKSYLTLNIVLYPEDLQETYKALDAAKEVRRWGEPKTLPPMNAHDRRIIHITLEKEADLLTEYMYKYL